MDLVDRFLEKNRSQSLTMHVIGDAIKDEYYEISVKRISPESPTPILFSQTSIPEVRFGGAANVAQQTKNFNVKTDLICLPWEDQSIFDNHRAFEVFKYPLETEGYLKTSKWLGSLPVKRRFFDNGIQIMRHDIELDLCGLEPGVIERLIESIEMKTLPNVAVFSDYDKGFFSTRACILQKYKGTKTVVDPKNGPLNKWRGCTVFKPNAKEALELSGKTDWRDQSRFFKDEIGCESVVITFGGEKVVGIDNNQYFSFIPDRKVRVQSVVGAGDAFVSIFALAIGHDFSVSEAAEIAWNAGAAYVQRGLNSPISPAELSTSQITNPNDLANRDFKLAFTNGCFDVLHSQHIELLKFAKSKADKLVVALNDDYSCNFLKGDARPIVPLEHRMAVMKSLKFVDFVTSFSEFTPLEIIKKIKPDCIIKGSDYLKNEVIGLNEVQGNVFLFPYKEGISTTNILNKSLVD